MFEESPIRSIVKAVSWRVVATATTTLLVWLFTGEVGLALTVGAFEAVAKMALYFLHERAWNRLRFGRRPAVTLPGPTTTGSKNNSDNAVRRGDGTSVIA